MTIYEDEEPSEQTQLRDALELVLGVAIESASELHTNRMNVGLKAEEQFKTLASVLGYRLDTITVRIFFIHRESCKRSTITASCTIHGISVGDYVSHYGTYH